MGASCAYVIYDTFSFRLTLPPNSRNLEFCVCFRTDGKEYWDNNQVSTSFQLFRDLSHLCLTSLSKHEIHFCSFLQGINYKLTNRVSARQEENEFLIQLSPRTDNKENANKEQLANKFLSTSPSDAVGIPKPKFGTWSEFSSRNETLLPYW